LDIKYYNQYFQGLAKVVVKIKALKQASHQEEKRWI